MREKREKTNKMQQLDVYYADINSNVWKEREKTNKMQQLDVYYANINSNVWKERKNQQDATIRCLLRWHKQ